MDLEHGTQKLDDENINELISGIQKVSQTGATRLPSRDISVSYQKNVQDLQAIPNYVPETARQQEIDDEMEETPGVQQQFALQTNIYDELQLPLFVCVLYLLFQLHVVKKYVFHFFPFLFLVDGNFNIYGHVFMSVLYTVIVFCMKRYLI